MRSSSEHNAAAPRWRTLSVLTVGVLFAHLYVLTGGWPDGMGTDPMASSGGSPDAMPPASLTTQTTPPATATDLGAPITSSRVRWILPKPPEPPPPPETKPPPPKPRPAPPPTQPEMAEAPPPMPEVPLALSDEPERLLIDAPSADPADDWMAEPVLVPDVATLEPPVASPAVGPAATAGDGDGAMPARPLDPPAQDAPMVTEQALPPAQVPPSMRLMYEVTGRVKGINYNASGSLDWENQGGRYEAHMVVRALFVGSREQTSVGSVASTGLVPERFGDKSRSERAAHFDGQNQRIRFSNNAPDADWMAGGQDRLSVFMQLAALLQARPEGYPAGTVVSLQVTGPGDAEVWRFEMGAEETLTLPAGELRTRHVKRVPRKPYDTQTELWLAPQLNHLPARLRITQHNGDHVEQSLRYLP